MGATVYREMRFAYQECLDCGSVYVEPMPDAETLAQMYGDDYGQFISLEEAHSGGEGTGNAWMRLERVHPRVRECREICGHRIAGIGPDVEDGSRLSHQQPSLIVE